MSTDTTTDSARTVSLGPDAVSLDRYSDVETDDGELIVYDEEDEAAWVQSSTWIALEFMA